MVTSLMLPARKHKLKHKITSDRRCFSVPLDMLLECLRMTMTVSWLILNATFISAFIYDDPYFLVFKKPAREVVLDSTVCKLLLRT